MENYTLPIWIYVLVLTMLLGGAMKKLMAAPTLVLWLGATVLLERPAAFCLLALLLLVLVVLLIYSWSCTPPTLPAWGKAVLITGCDSGFGNATARCLDELGFQVFGTVLDISGEGARELRRACSAQLTLIQLDITQPQQVQQALLDTQAKLGVRDLWALVNNAGVCVNFGDTELSLMSNFRGCMEVNFFGTLNVTKTFLPLIRKARGRVITVSSPSGDQPFPCLAAYGASKAALNLLINTLRHELQPWGVHVCTVLPSAYKTGKSCNHAYWDQQYKYVLQNLSPALLEDYGEDYMLETKELFHNHAQTASEDLSPVVQTIVQALLSPRPQVRYYAGPGVGLMYLISSYLPYTISDWFLQKLFVKKKLLPQFLRRQSDLHNIHNLHNNNNNNEEKLKM